MNHTPTPWKATHNPFDVTDFHVYVIEKDLSISDGKIALVENITDAEFIVRAVNTHDNLLKSAKEALEFIRGKTTKEPIFQKLEQAIAAAERKE